MSRKAARSHCFLRSGIADEIAMSHVLAVMARACFMSADEAREIIELAMVN